ncbi:HlyD family secretion protein [Kordiimonas lipolytica]|uniref:HlyD family secretion protein n=1 Tax=Kordiimonas lipolytica TaxID=1662421 RepID=A0ABV8UBN6_9PROT|nr:HlyD family efflux transporter periplasmic adaptor subunit [Kordiimonas lipolytica]
MPFRERHINHFQTLASIRMPRIMRVIAWMLGLGTLAIILFLIFTPWVQTASGFGTVTALNPTDRQQELNALVSGRIKEWYVRDGSRVKAGDPIVKVVDNDPNFLQSLEAERAQAMAKLRAMETAVLTAEIDLDRTRKLLNEGLASQRDLEQARLRIESLRGDTADASAQLNRLDIGLSRGSTQMVKAPRDGFIHRVLAGDTATFVKAGDPVATFIPEKVERAVELYIDGRDIGLARLGDRVRLQFEGWPVVQFSGWPSVAVGTFGGRIVAIDPAAGTGGRFRVLVSEDPDDLPWPDNRLLRLGAKARGWITFETVTVGYEVWRQLNNFPAEFRPEATKANADAGAK